ncbi:hypothetical protein BJ322DRAFT_427965 [Thelephora terrestris]|uniref:C2H2-type domain-containing protein n=1 Tax=Thelephora terrestris TaxID=56493 RepID=A0A9P6HRB4_9AGAM|nr:hypothetical protein BJ322DRAFT_427965 [Thelephora terrestris]
MAFTAPSLRRARSDGGGRVSGHRHSRSEGGISYPPSSHPEFIARTAADNLSAAGQQFLHPTEPISSFYRGHHRRSSSGSRDRGGVGPHSTPGSSRASPYPSPKASPLLGYDPLPSIPSPQSLPVSSRSRPTSMPAYGASSFGLPPGGIGELGQQLDPGSNLADMDPHLGNSTTPGSLVSKPNVTTTATAEASERRRKTDANFACPVPGCGSTFTRHFNLKGHMRSHNEEKPFQCKWPGCGKGFARAHDCKRHEQLHFNYRPHKCEGCNKSFQRMDALNRHRKFISVSSNQSSTQSFQSVQREDRTVRRLRTKPKPMAPSVPLGSALETRWDQALRTLLVASWRWTSAVWVPSAAITVAMSKLSPITG